MQTKAPWEHHWNKTPAVGRAPARLPGTQGVLEKSATPWSRERSSWPRLSAAIPGALSLQALRKEIYSSKENAPSPPRASCRALGQDGPEAVAWKGAAGKSLLGAEGLTPKSAVTT